MNGLVLPSTRSAADLSVFDHPDQLPPGALALFAGEGVRDGFYGTAAWYRVVLETALPTGFTGCFVLARLNGRNSALVPLQRDVAGVWQSLTTPYTCLYQPLLAPDLSADGLYRVGLAMARLCRTGVRLDALDADWPGLAPFTAGLRAGGLIPLRFDHFGNWHESVTGLSWADYLATRDGALRQTIRRRTAKAVRDGRIGFELHCHPDTVAVGIVAFETVYASSWKEPEPYPSFNAALMHMAAAQGVLRLGVMRCAGQPIAVQYWVMTGGRASVLKLAHDEAARALSPGTVLTSWMIQRFLDDEGVDELDFGRGDDPYKQGWASQRRGRIGVMLVSLRRWQGLAALARHLAGLCRRWLRERKTKRSPSRKNGGH